MDRFISFVTLVAAIMFVSTTSDLAFAADEKPDAAAEDSCIKACNECLRACRECLVGRDCPT